MDRYMPQLKGGPAPDQQEQQQDAGKQQQGAGKQKQQQAAGKQKQPRSGKGTAAPDEQTSKKGKKKKPQAET